MQSLLNRCLNKMQIKDGNNTFLSAYMGIQWIPNTVHSFEPDLIYDKFSGAEFAPVLKY